ncbi:Rossmann-fold NAD(P)-binding domain-containing protein [Methanoplanus limicola]|uniref:Alanine dehydrogenase n=1 Tax=Methanoplanus limicola DSM 2279 TaxID=937775 RepID=H1YYT3_9EURY|nr:hypothetical protein [Methanoplanus limicola]EHQ37005.1 L-alanine dehydrogenase [Methanoplanus limicola DSM 2279]
MRYYPNPSENADLGLINNAIEEAFSEHGRGNVRMPPKSYIFFDKGDFRTMPAYIPSLNIAGVKVVNVHPNNREHGLPTVMALLILIDPKTGYPYALMNATELTDLRTAAAGAVAAKHLSPKKSVVMGVMGSGNQAKAQIAATAAELEIEELRIWSRDGRNAEKLCELYSRYECRSEKPEKVCDCDLLVTTTPSVKPVVKDEWINKGTHINAIGADAPGKQELEATLLKRATVIVDDYAQALHSGEINIPISSGYYTEKEISGTIGEYVLGKKARRSSDEITIFDSTGLAIQDLAIAKAVIISENTIKLNFP